MNNSKRVIVNTLAQYGRTVFNMLLSLYTVRIVLSTLGASDYGIYTVIAGVTSMLAFMTNALISTTQRFMSYYQGQNSVEKMKEVFSNSEILHLVVGVVISAILLIISPLIFDGFLNIPAERLAAARKVYIVVIFILFITFCSAPFRALLISHENIVYISVIDMLDGIIKVVLISILPFMQYDKLILYSIILLLMQIFNFGAFSIYSFKQYQECILPKFRLFNKRYVVELSSYAGWVIYGMGCIMGRSQGLAIIINKFLGTIANAAYGLGFQVSSAVSTVSVAFLNAMRPQIVKSEGASDRSRAIKLSSMLCKFSFFLLSAICVPCVFEMPQLLSLWLGDVPQYTVMFARMALIAGMVDTLTLGLSVINEAVGNIRSYNLVISTLKLLTLPLIWLSLHIGLDLKFIVVIYVFVELLSAMARVPFVHYTTGLKIRTFINTVVLRESVPFIVLILVNVLIVSYVNINLRFLLTIALSCITYAVMIFLIGLESYERKYIMQFIKK